MMHSRIADGDSKKEANAYEHNYSNRYNDSINRIRRVYPATYLKKISVYDYIRKKDGNVIIYYLFLLMYMFMFIDKQVTIIIVGIAKNKQA
jgi:hypothetical protein